MKLDNLLFREISKRNPPDFAILREHIKQGMSLAKWIQKLVGENIEVRYTFTHPDDFEKKKVRNAKTVYLGKKKGDVKRKKFKGKVLELK